MSLNVLDIAVSSKQTVLNEINALNNTNLTFDQIEFSLPNVENPVGSNWNTSVQVVGIKGSSYTGAATIYYKRLDLASVLATPSADIIPGNFTLLSELIPTINSLCGINLQASDYFDQPLPAYDPLNLNAIPRVMVTAKSDSYMFYGAYSLQLGVRKPLPVDTGVTRAYYIQVDGYSVTDYNKMFVSVDNNGNTNSSFSFLRNATGITKVNTVNSILLNNDDIALNGSFGFTMNAPGTTTPTVVDASSIILRNDGSVKSFSNTTFVSLGTPITNKNVPWLYVVDPTIPSNSSHLYRYGQDGVLDSSFNPVIPYTPALVSLCDDGKIYTVSPEFTAPLATNNNIPSKQVRLDRFTSAGLPDGVNPNNALLTILSGNGNSSPITFAQIVPIVNNGFWALMLPVTGVSLAANSPVVNGVPFVPGGIQTASAWNPVVRFAQDGSLFPTPSTLLLNNQPTSIYEPIGSSLTQGDKVLVGDASTVAFLSYKANPITGYVHKQPLLFNDLGEQRLLSGINYKNLYRWSYAQGLMRESNGKLTCFGAFSAIVNGGGWNDFIQTVARYKSDGSVDNLLFQDLTAGSVIKNVLMSEVIN
jgi:hypothetical protein